MSYIHLLWLLCACGPRKQVVSDYDAHAADDELLTTRFAWPGSFTAEVEVREHGQLVQNGETTDSDAHFVVRMQGSMEGDSHRLAWSDFRYVAADGAPPPADLPLMKLAWEYTPHLIISGEGELLDCQSQEIPPDAMDAALAEVGVDMPAEQRQILEDLIRQAAGGPAREQATAADWAQGIGFWVGKELESNTVYEAEEVPAASFIDLMLVEEFEWEGWTACVPGGDNEACVKLTRRLRPRDEQVKTNIEAALRVQAAAEGWEEPDKLHLLDFETGWESSLVLDPETMLPWYTASTTRSRQRVRLPDGTEKDESAETSETRAFRYLR